MLAEACSFQEDKLVLMLAVKLGVLLEWMMVERLGYQERK